VIDMILSIVFEVRDESRGQSNKWPGRTAQSPSGPLLPCHAPGRRIYRE
jgi:hypothetical protein